jgi:cation transporter-like permease
MASTTRRNNILLLNSGEESFASIVDLIKASSSSLSSVDSTSPISNEEPLQTSTTEATATATPTTTTTNTTRNADILEQSARSIMDTNKNDSTMRIMTQQHLLGQRHPHQYPQHQYPQHQYPQHHLGLRDESLVAPAGQQQQHYDHHLLYPPPSRPTVQHTSPQVLQQENDRLRNELESLQKQMRHLQQTMEAQQQPQTQTPDETSRHPPSMLSSPATGPLLNLPLIFRQGQQLQYRSDNDDTDQQRQRSGTNHMNDQNKSNNRNAYKKIVEPRIGVDIDVYQSASGLSRRSSQSHTVSGEGVNNNDLVGTKKSLFGHNNKNIGQHTKRSPVNNRRKFRIMTDDTCISSDDDGSENDDRALLSSDDISTVESQQRRSWKSGDRRHGKHKRRSKGTSSTSRGGIVVASGSPMSHCVSSPRQHPQPHHHDQMSFYQSVTDRAGWLVGLLIFQSLSSFILARNESLLKHHTVIVQFLTMLVGAGGNAGNQASVGVVRGLAVGTIDRSNVKQFLMRELVMGVALSLILGIAGFVRASVFLVPPLETFAITSSLLLIVIISVVAGATLPLAMHLAGIDPAHSSTTIQVIMDITGVVITVGVSSWVLDSAVVQPT